jgi:hypothetical protein
MSASSRQLWPVSRAHNTDAVVTISFASSCTQLAPRALYSLYKYMSLPPLPKSPVHHNSSPSCSHPFNAYSRGATATYPFIVAGGAFRWPSPPFPVSSLPSLSSSLLVVCRSLCNQRSPQAWSLLVLLVPIPYCILVGRSAPALTTAWPGSPLCPATAFADSTPSHGAHPRPAQLLRMVPLAATSRPCVVVPSGGERRGPYGQHATAVPAWSSDPAWPTAAAAVCPASAAGLGRQRAHSVVAIFPTRPPARIEDDGTAWFFPVKKGSRAPPACCMSHVVSQSHALRWRETARAPPCMQMFLRPSLDTLGVKCFGGIGECLNP